MSKKDSVYSIKSKWYLWSALTLIPFFMIVFVAFLHGESITQFDNWIAEPILSSRNTIATGLYVFFTDFGGELYLSLILFICSILFAWKESSYFPAIWLIVQSLLGAVLLNQVLKSVFRRSRPLVETLVEQGGFSFPSGHSMGSLICYGGILFLILRNIRRPSIRNGLIALVAILVLFIGISRIYVGVHYPTDIIGGFSVGAAWLIFATAMYPKAEHLYHHQILKKGD